MNTGLDEQHVRAFIRTQIMMTTLASSQELKQVTPEERRTIQPWNSEYPNVKKLIGLASTIYAKDAPERQRILASNNPEDAETIVDALCEECLQHYPVQAERTLEELTRWVDERAQHGLERVRTRMGSPQ